MKKSGQNLETIVRIIEEVYKNSSNTEIVNNYKIENESGNKREIDILIISKINDFEILIAIECKDYNKKIPCEKIEAFNSKCLRIPNINKKIFVSSKGFQKDAIEAAKTFGIETFTLKEVKDNSNIFFPPISQIVPKFSKLTIENIEYFPNPNIQNIVTYSNETIFYTPDTNEILTLYEIIKKAAEPYIFNINTAALFNWIKDENTTQKILFEVTCQEIYSLINTDKIYVSKISGNVEISIEFLETNAKKNTYFNNTNGKIKANTINFIIEDNIEGSVIFDNNNHAHFYNTSHNQISKLEILAKYDKKTDVFEVF